MGQLDTKVEIPYFRGHFWSICTKAGSKPCLLRASPRPQKSRTAMKRTRAIEDIEHYDPAQLQLLGKGDDQNSNP
jgi:hypothetical protein